MNDLGPAVATRRPKRGLGSQPCHNYFVDLERWCWSLLLHTYRLLATCTIHKTEFVSVITIDSWQFNISATSTCTLVLFAYEMRKSFGYVPIIYYSGRAPNFILKSGQWLTRNYRSSLASNPASTIVAFSIERSAVHCTSLHVASVACFLYLAGSWLVVCMFVGWSFQSGVR